MRSLIKGTTIFFPVSVTQVGAEKRRRDAGQEVDDIRLAQERTNFAIAARTYIYSQRCIPRGAMNTLHRIRRIKKFRIQQPHRRPCRPPSVFSIILLIYSFRAYLLFFQLNKAARTN